jgi:hypothetical protein
VKFQRKKKVTRVNWRLERTKMFSWHVEWSSNPDCKLQFQSWYILVLVLENRYSV